MSKEQQPAATTAVAKSEKTLADSMLARVNEFVQAGELKLPADYNVGNALKSAYLMLQDMKVGSSQKPVLEACTKASIANAMLKMVTQGLSASKMQGYFIPYGDQLNWQRSYFGTMTLAKREAGVKEIHANVIYEADKFAFEIDINTGRRRITQHESALQNIDNNKMVGAYAVVTLKDGSTDTTIMSMPEIRVSWSKSKSDNTQKQFPAEMAKRTVINRALKMLVNSATDNGMMDDDDEVTTPVSAAVKQTIAQEGNKETIGFTDVELVDDTPPTQPAAPEPAANTNGTLFADAPASNGGPGF